MTDHKLKGATRVPVAADEARTQAIRAFTARACPEDVARQVADHLIEADRSGVESHGLVRVLQYAREFETGLLDATARPTATHDAPNRIAVDGRGAIGITAMKLAVETATEAAQAQGLALSTLVNAGHTGRLGAFAEASARVGCLTIILGGGDRKRWRMVAPHGGTQALLPTNPWCIGMPGGDRGPVVLDIATSQVAGGWIYAARAAGVHLPEGMILDRHGQPTTDPEHWFDGGAILPKGGPLGYGLALVAELVGEAMLGPVDKGEINWLVLSLDTRNYRAAPLLQSAAEDILSEIRASTPVPGGPPVSVPGERERDRHSREAEAPLMLPAPVWDAIRALA